MASRRKFQSCRNACFSEFVQTGRAHDGLSRVGETGDLKVQIDIDPQSFIWAR
jgi:hypothetical protein